MGRSPCCSKEEGLNRGAWTAHEDKVLSEYIKIHGEGRWRNLPKKAGLMRCGKSCRLRWLNYLRPDIKRGNISPEEEELIIRLHKLLGNRWSLIAGRIPGRTDNEIKNYWNTNLGKKIQDRQISCTRKSTSGETKSISKRSTSNHFSSLPSPSPSRMAAHVVRTKATKCTKVVLDDPPPDHHQVEHFGVDKHTVSESNTLNGLSASSFSTTTTTATATATATATTREEDNSSTDFILNFNATEELFLSDLLNSDICDYNEKYCNNSVLSPSVEDHQALMFSEDFIMNFHSFTSLLDAGGEWLAAETTT